MDRPALIKILDDFIDAFEGWDKARTPESREAGDDYYGHMLEWYPLVVAIAERHAPRVVSGAMATIADNIDDQDWWRAKTIALATRGVIERGEELEAALGPADDVPQLAADSLHPNVWGAAKAYWEAELYSAGIEAAAKALTAVIQHKARRHDLDGTELIDQVLSPDGPKLGRPGKLIVHAGQRTKTAQSIRLGVHALGRACYLALRNPAAHTTDELDEQIALEQLAAFSLLARFVDEAIYIVPKT